jgi:hypothetical protein
MLVGHVDLADLRIVRETIRIVASIGCGDDRETIGVDDRDLVLIGGGRVDPAKFGHRQRSVNTGDAFDFADAYSSRELHR